MGMRGIRGAATVESDTKEEIWRTAQKLIKEIVEKNKIEAEQIGAMIFSSTEDLKSAFPTAGVRQLPEFALVPLFDTRQIAVEDSLTKCIRVLILAETDKNQKEICHVYLGGAKKLRPDLIS